MKPAQKSWFLAFAVTVYAAWQARDIVPAWQHAPYDRLGWLAFGIWVSPLIAGRWLAKTAFTQPVPVLLAAGLAISFLGTVVSLNTLNYAGLVCAITSYFPWCWRNLVWLMAAAAWMPALGYALDGLATGSVTAVRLVFSAAGSVWMIWWLRTPREAHE
jgi:hypothetical protein